MIRLLSIPLIYQEHMIPPLVRVLNLSVVITRPKLELVGNYTGLAESTFRTQVTQRYKSGTFLYLHLIGWMSLI